MLPKELQGDWTTSGVRLLQHVLQKPPVHDKISFDWVCSVLQTRWPQLKIALTNNGAIGQNLVERYTNHLEYNGWPSLVLFSKGTNQYGVFVRNEKGHTMDIVCKGVGKRAFVWSTSSGD